MEKYGVERLNDGVHGGSALFRHTFKFSKQYGHEPQEVRLQAAFGKGKDRFRSNIFPSPPIDKFSADIKFGKVLNLIKWRDRKFVFWNLSTNPRSQVTTLGHISSLRHYMVAC